MRVTIASRIFSPEPAAASFRLAALADALDEAGHEVTVLTVTDRKGQPATTRPGVRVKRAPALRDREGYIRGYAQYMSFDIPLVFRLLLSKRPSVIVAEPPPTTGLVVRVVSALKRTHYVYYAADIWSDAAESTGVPRLVVSAVRWMEAVALRGATRVIAVSDGVADRVRVLSGHERVDVITNGIDTSVFTPQGPKLDMKPYAVYAGTTSEWQGADIFIRAMPRVQHAVPDARLVFIGQGSAWDSLQELARELAPDAVEFNGLVPPQEAAKWLRSANVGLVSLLPGLGYDFAFPTKVFAALASGTPVLFVGPGPAAEAMAGVDFGSAVDYRVEDVADQLIRFLSGPISDELRQAASEWANENSSVAQSSRKAAAVVADSADN